MDYQDWIVRERNFRISLLRDWPEARDQGIYRVCQDCGEICLCAEKVCPNCSSLRIAKAKLELSELTSGRRIRCLKRYQNLD